MRIKTVKFKVYKYSELSEEAKDKVRQDHAEAFGYERSEEAMASIKALAEHFDGHITDWNVYYDRSSCSSMVFDMPEDMTKLEIANRLKTLGRFNRNTLKGHGDCKLTGYCLDEGAIDGFRWAWYRGKEKDLNDLMQAAFKSWLKECQDDDEYLSSDESMSETADANEYEYKENGTLV